MSNILSIQGTIRPAEAADFETVRQITRTTIEAVYPQYYPAGAVAFFLAHHNDAAIRNDILENRVFLYISDDGQAAGTVTVHDNDIGRLFVLPGFQGRGFGKALLDFAENCVSERFSEIFLDASWPAKGLYLKRGYQPESYHVIETENGDFLCFDTMKKQIL
ncbi:MAG: GNAT family N-acetyltransferase [Oscillospiraceae bacterium]|nr:GNAT family N-acetyltransferase [Oscillospiraceae bacterium]